MKSRGSLVKWVVLAIIAVVVLILAILMSSTKETYVSNDENNISRIDSVTCVSGEIEDAFFGSGQESKVQHTIRATFKSDTLDKMSYDFNGAYSSDVVAEAAEAEMHANYNVYMGENGLSTNLLSPIFSVAGNKVDISLYVKVSDLINTTIPFFFLDMDDFQKIRSYSMDKFVKLYKNKGFSCTTLE